MLLAGIHNLPHIDLRAEVYSLGVLLLELGGRQHHLHHSRLVGCSTPSTHSRLVGCMKYMMPAPFS